MRIPYTYYVTINPDWLYNITDVCIWSVVEVGTGTTASSMACLRPLFQEFLSRSKLLGSSTRRSNAQSNTRTAMRAGYVRSGGDQDKSTYKNGKKSIQVTTVVKSYSNKKSEGKSDNIELGQQQTITSGSLAGENGWNNSTDKLANSSSEAVGF